MCVFLASLALGFPSFAFGEDAAKAHVAVVRFSNGMSSSSYDAACNAATDTLFLTLREFGRYRVQIEEGVGAGEEALRAMAAERQLDFIMYGKMSKAGSAGIECTLSVFDRAKGKTTISQTRKAAGVLDVFDATDALVVAVLETMTGAHIGFGEVKLTNTGEKGSYTVLVDGTPVGNDLGSLERVLIGKRRVTIAQKRMLGTREIASSIVDVKEGETDEVRFSVPYMMDDEKAKMEGLRAAILADWDYANTAVDLDAKTVELVSLFGDLSYCPRLSADKEKAMELAGEWALRKNRLAIESSAWDPRTELLDGVQAIYSGAKAYPDPTKIRQVFEENAQLVATLFELKAGRALGDGDLDKGLECFKDALMLSTRYLDGARMTDYAYAITTLKDLQGNIANGANITDDQSLKAVFGDWILAGQRFYGMREQGEAGTVCIVVASDLARSLSADGGEFSQAPLMEKALTAPRSVNIQPKGLANPLALEAAVGERLLFAQDGFESFGKAPVQVAETPVLDAHKIYSSLVVMPATEGTLYLDGASMGYVSGGSDVKIDPVEVGDRSLELLYADGYAEQHTVSVVMGMAVNAAFTYRMDFMQIPRAAIKIDGLFDDWKGVPPIFMAGKQSPQNLKLAIDKVYLAVDEKNLYMRFDIKDTSPNAFLKPNNFNTEQHSQYSVTLNNGSNRVEILVRYYAESNSWGGLAQKFISEHKWEAITSTVSFRLNGPSLEAAFPLDQIRKKLGVLDPGRYYKVFAGTGRSNDDWRWIPGDSTITKHVTF